MAKLMLLSALIMAIAIPTRMARDENPRRGFRRMLLFYLLFCFVYVLMLKYFFFRFAT